MSQENTTGKQPLIRYVNRQQMSWRAVDVERLMAKIIRREPFGDWLGAWT